MFYISEIKKLYEAIKADSSIQDCDKEKIVELVRELIEILVQY